ncbi:alpha/beta fold hydrolase [Mycolicibacterium sp. D5.8-2]|uniref:alpha/beta fold hydrolase n=1 Tax=Mycolicibacterium sp. D5.8-2 TaxID=3085903 RepID=UPI00298D1148|nr:alpha/beta fold hydrolase [Mycolicibacterium sp. D5.8-2]MDW5609715.1 alpha/beta fold hydrolase [Mycolicibacterium sp. D5.8-2]
MTAPERLVVDLPHLRVEALAWGPAEGRLMLCLHGYPDSAWTWRHLGPHFADKAFRVVAPFTRGYAPTQVAPDADYGIGALMYDAMALHTALGGDADAVVVGHDWGGLTANGLAAHPDNPFEKVVSMGVPLVAGLKAGSGRGRALLRALPRQMRMSWYILFQQLPVVSERALDRVIPKLWRDWCPPGYDPTADLRHVWESLPTHRHRTAALSYYRAAFRPLRRTRSHSDLDRYAIGQIPRTPMLVMHGGVDGAIDPRLGALGTHVLPQGSRHHMIDGAGHFMHLDKPAEVHRLIGDYVVG